MSTLTLRTPPSNMASTPPPPAAEVSGSSFTLVLPTDILLYILSVSSPASIRRCQQVCRFMRYMIRADAYIQYLLQLDACGYVQPLNPRTDMSYAEKTNFLRSHNARWRNPNTVTPVCYELPPGRAVGAHTFVKGTLMWRPDASEPDHLPINFYQLPSGNRGTGFKRWSLDLVEFQGFHSLWMDPEQDLLVVVLETGGTFNKTTYELYLRSMATGDAHPASHGQHILSHAIPTGSSEAMRIEIVGRSLAMVSHSSWPSAVDVVVWDWQTGGQPTYLSYKGSSSIELLSEDSFVIAHSSTSPDADIDVPKDTLGCLKVYRFGLHNAMPAQAAHVASFLLALPPNLHGRPYSGIKICSAPATTAPNAHGYCCSSPKVYELAPEDRLLCIDVLMPSNYFYHGTQVLGTLYAPSSALLNLLSPCKPQVDRLTHSLIPWASWARHAFWGSHSRSSSDRCIRMFGRRAVISHLGSRGQLSHPNILKFHWGHMALHDTNEASRCLDNSTPRRDGKEQRPSPAEYANEASGTCTESTLALRETSSNTEWYSDWPWVDDEHLVLQKASV
ncbi:hypothetical protein FS749_001793 [Ceratobasidium sp. UAMH 11750]|nr:hypothetical protein FS749_001793 [Ceratobasidium sp. UAMH 11750]